MSKVKRVRSKDYNYDFHYDTGLFVRWGATIDDDPLFSPFGPELLDVEVSTICHGIKGNPCPWCYKSNTPIGRNMALNTFKELFHKIPKNLTQIAFGIGDIDSNPDLFKIFEYCRNNDHNIVIPNVTVNGWNLTDELADKLAQVCGAVAVSNYDTDICYGAVKKLTQRIGKKSNTLKQVNIHQLTSLNTFESCKRVLRDKLKDDRLVDLNAVIFLAFKNKGRGARFDPLPNKSFKELIDFSLKNNISIGMDSCSAFKFLTCIRDHKDYEKYTTFVEPCESGLFSLYINVDDKSYFCSFMEKESGVQEFDINKCQDFLKEVWFHSKMKEWREQLLATAIKNALTVRECPRFKI